MQRRGVEVRKCIRCGFIAEQRPLPKEEHVPGEWEVRKAPSCTKAGSRIIACKICGKKLDYQDIEPLGHDFSEWETIRETSCASPGLKKRSCKRCGGKVEKEPIPSLPHTPSDWITLEEPTLFKSGSKHTICTVCGHELNSEEVPCLPAKRFVGTLPDVFNHPWKARFYQEGKKRDIYEDNVPPLYFGSNLTKKFRDPDDDCCKKVAGYMENGLYAVDIPLSLDLIDPETSKTMYTRKDFFFFSSPPGFDPAMSYLAPEVKENLYLLCQIGLQKGLYAILNNPSSLPFSPESLISMENTEVRLLLFNAILHLKLHFSPLPAYSELNHPAKLMDTYPSEIEGECYISIYNEKGILEGDLLADSPDKTLRGKLDRTWQYIEESHALKPGYTIVLGDCGITITEDMLKGKNDFYYGIRNYHSNMDSMDGNSKKEIGIFDNQNNELNREGHKYLQSNKGNAAKSVWTILLQNVLSFRPFLYQFLYTSYYYHFYNPTGKKVLLCEETAGLRFTIESWWDKEPPSE